MQLGIWPRSSYEASSLRDKLPDEIDIEQLLPATGEPLDSLSNLGASAHAVRNVRLLELLRDITADRMMGMTEGTTYGNYLRLLQTLEVFIEDLPSYNPNGPCAGLLE